MNAKENALRLIVSSVSLLQEAAAFLDQNMDDVGDDFLEQVIELDQKCLEFNDMVRDYVIDMNIARMVEAGTIIAKEVGGETRYFPAE